MTVKMLTINDVSLCEGKKGFVSVITLLQSVGVKGGRNSGGGEGSSLQICRLLQKQSFQAAASVQQPHPGAAHPPAAASLHQLTTASALEKQLIVHSSFKVGVSPPRRHHHNGC